MLETNIHLSQQKKEEKRGANQIHLDWNILNKALFSTNLPLKMFFFIKIFDHTIKINSQNNSTSSYNIFLPNFLLSK